MNRKKLLTFLKSYKKYIFISFLIIPVLVLSVFAGTALYNIARASFGSWGDTSLVHGCKDQRGRVTIVASTDSCNGNETQVTWLKDVDAGNGLSISRSSSGATLSLENTATDGWTDANETWTYASATTISVPSDATTKYSIGDKIRLKQGGGYKYYYVIGITSTVLTVTGGSDYSVVNETITDNDFSKASTPLGFPQWFNWSSTLNWDGTAPSNVAQSTSRFSLVGKTVFLRLKYEYSTAGANNKVLYFGVPVPANGQTSEYNTPGSGYMSTGVAGSQPTISAHTAFQYGTNGEVYMIIDSSAAIKSVWVALFYEI